MWSICFDFYARQLEVLEAKKGSRIWENLKNLFMEQIARLLEKSYHFCFFIVFI